MTRLLYLVSEDWYFMSHRLPMARAALAAGFEVHVATRVDKDGAAIEAEGFRLHRLNWRRGSLNPIDLIRAGGEVRRLYRTLVPDLVHQVSLWPAAVGSCAALGLPVRRVSTMAGLGFVFGSSTARAKILRAVFGLIFRVLFNRPNSAVIVQNPDDRATLLAIGMDKDRLFLIPGSGVDTGTLTPLPEPRGAITVGFAGRLLEIKGLRTLIAAQRQLATDGTGIRLLIAGRPDPFNPASIPTGEIEQWRQQDGVELLGHIGDIRALWTRAHIAVQPSRGGEGLPKSLLEAAACGRPIVATDVPGCREIARNGVNALTVPPDDSAALAAAIKQLVSDADLRAVYGAAGRRIAETEFSATLIGTKTVALYRDLLAQSQAR